MKSFVIYEPITNISVDAVVWNPWIEKSKRMAKKDYLETEYKEMVNITIGHHESRKTLPQ